MMSDTTRRLLQRTIELLASTTGFCAGGGSEPFVSLRYFGPDVHKTLPNVGDHAK